MDRARWERVESVLADAIARPSDARRAYLDEACTGDAELRREVEELLVQHETDPLFLETPLVRLHELDTAQAVGVSDARRIGSYRLVRMLGRGGMGEVYLAIQQGAGFERSVALKVIRQGMDTEELLRRFQLERRILASLKHPNIAHLVEAGATEEGRPYFVMEYVVGLPIDEYCDGHGYTVTQRLRLFQAVCDAVQHAHRNLIVHRDLKPGNILVGTDGVPKLLDFGIGKLLDAGGLALGPDATRAEARVLTPEYASPEQLRGEPVTAASDVYGLGILLYKLMTAHHPYAAGKASAVELERAALEQEPDRPSEAVRRNGEISRQRGTTPARLRRSLAGDLDNIVLKALRKDPERRYTSAAALAEDIQRHLDGLPVQARPDTFTYRAAKFVGRHRLPVSAAALVFVALAASTVYATGQSRRVARERDKALEVRSFLLEMFGASAPDQATGDTVTARQLLDRQVETLQSAYADEPELRAQMMAVLAEGYDRLGLVPRADSMAREALEVRRRVLPAEHPDIAVSLSLLGWLLHEQGRREEGERLLREAVPIWRGSRPVDAAGLARTLNDLGVLREAAGDYDEAEGLYREALDLRSKRFGEGHRSFAVTASNLSVVLYRKGDYQGAVERGRTALQAMRRAVGGDHQRSIIIQGNLAAMKVALRDYDAGEAEYLDLLDRQTRIQGRRHPVTVGIIQSLGTLLYIRERYADAEPYLREALETLEGSLGPSHPRVANALATFGGTLAGLGRFDDALPLLERALAIHREVHGEVHARVAETLETLAKVHWQAGDRDAGEPLYRQAVELWRKALDPEHPDVAKAESRLARMLLLSGESAEALAIYQSAHPTLARLLPPESDFVIETRLRMAQALIALGRYGAADSALAVHAASLRGAQAEDGGPPARWHRALADSLRAALARRLD